MYLKAHKKWVILLLLLLHNYFVISINQTISHWWWFTIIFHISLWIATSEWSRAAPHKIVLFTFAFFVFKFKYSIEESNGESGTQNKNTQNKEQKKIILIYVRIEWNIIVDWGKKKTLFTLYAFDRRPNVSTYTFKKHSALRCVATYKMWESFHNDKSQMLTAI